GPDRATALRRLDAALAETVVLGIETNIAFLRSLCTNERVVSGDLDTGLIEALLPVVAAAPSDRMLAAARHHVLHGSALTPEIVTQRAGGVWSALSDNSARPTAFLTDADEVVDAVAEAASAI